MFLSDGKIGSIYEAQNIVTDNKIKRRLEVLGLTKGTKIQILNKNINGSLIFKVRGTRFAISKNISSAIRVKKI